ncbi:MULTISPECIES: nuclear transport factor 2 family protein [Streptomyces]|uniref:Nuclear transport factor 2 family protein n=1 Tax=Streptomyces flaveolus TaxID=67297 RepID=A0ABV3APM3_9ACTN|nr:nuclear transport factor 2 family protein [Streptomyces sp. NRRL F-3307]
MLPTAHVEKIRDGAFISWHLDEYYALFRGRPASEEPTRTCHIDTIDVHGTVATATMSLSCGADTFTDIFLSNRSDAAGASPTTHGERSSKPLVAARQPTREHRRHHLPGAQLPCRPVLAAGSRCRSAHREGGREARAGHGAPCLLTV